MSWQTRAQECTFITNCKDDPFDQQSMSVGVLIICWLLLACRFLPEISSFVLYKNSIFTFKGFLNITLIHENNALFCNQLCMNWGCNLKEVMHKLMWIPRAPRTPPGGFWYMAISLVNFPIFTCTFVKNHLYSPTPMGGDLFFV